jgi:hypothetical protein
MADYVLPGVVEKRVRFFDGQFLQDQDFVDEQDYQLDREHRHNRLLHGPGVADGLTVTSATANQVTVAPGTAIDSDGNQMVLAQPATLDLPAADFNDKQGIQIYLSFVATATDQQTVGGSSDFTRWLERPQLTALAPGNAYSGTASPVLLASVALDNAGRVTVDNAVRTYSGLRLPGPGADAATLRATSGGQLDLAGGLTVEGNLGVGTSTPGAKLEVVGGGGVSVDLVVNGRMRSDNNDGGLWVTQDRFVGGYGTGQMGFWNNGDWRLTVLNNGNVGIGTHTPGARLEVAGGGGASVDFVVNGRMRSDNNDGGLWVTSDRFVGGFGTDNIGFWSNGDWRLWVMNNGQVVTKSDLFVSGRLVYADGGGQWWHIHPQPSFGVWWAANDGVGGPSDVRLKTDVRPVTDALGLVSKLQAVRYRWGECGLSHFTRDIETSLSAGPDATGEEHQQARDAERGKALDALSGDRLGLVAQDVEAVLPELVHDDADGYKHIRYQHLTALLAEAIKEQDAVVRALSAEIAALRAASTEGARSLCGSRRNGGSASSRPSCRKDSKYSPSLRPGKPSCGRPCCASAERSRCWRNWRTGTGGS